MLNYDYHRETTKGKKRGSFSCQFKDQNVEGVLTTALPDDNDLHTWKRASSDMQQISPPAKSVAADQYGQRKKFLVPFTIS